MTASNPPSPLAAQIGALIAQRTGLALVRQYQQGLDRLLHEVADGDLAILLHDLRSSPEHSPRWQAVLRACAIGETYFLRDVVQFRLLRDTILPGLIAERMRTGRRELSLWSAGCATGEEAYSLAVLLHELLADRARWSLSLLGTDINLAALAAARGGQYREWSFRHTPPTFRAQYFQAVNGGWQINPTIAALPNFHYGNLLEDAPLARYDLILCRNVLLYFSPDQAAAAESALYEALAPGGWLLLGHAESLRGDRGRWILHHTSGTFVYQKPLRTNTRPLTARSGTGPLRLSSDVDIGAAVRALRAADYVEAETLLTAILDTDSRHARAHTLMAYIHANRSDPQAAHLHLDQALDADPLLADAHYMRAELLLEAGREAEAQSALRAALYCQRDHPLAAFTLGKLYIRQRDLFRATRAWHKALDGLKRTAPELPFSDLSDLTGAHFAALVRGHLTALGDQPG